MIHSHFLDPDYCAIYRESFYLERSRLFLAPKLGEIYCEYAEMLASPLYFVGGLCDPVRPILLPAYALDTEELLAGISLRILRKPLILAFGVSKL